MITFDENQTNMQRLAQDYKADSLVFLNRMANVGYKKILAQLGRQVTERIRTTSTVADQRAYMSPPDTAWIKAITIISGTTKYPLIPVESDVDWDYLTQNDFSGIPQHFIFRPRLGVGGGVIELNPIPGQVYTMKVIYEANDKDLRVTEHTTGTVSVTKGSNTITGASSPAWTAGMIGRYFKATQDGHEMWYRIKGYTSSTSLQLENAYDGESASGLSYRIAEAFNLPEDLQDAPMYYAMWHWFLTKKDQFQANTYKGLWKDAISSARSTYASRTRIPAHANVEMGGIFPQTYPAHFPQGGIS